MASAAHLKPGSYSARWGNWVVALDGRDATWSVKLFRWPPNTSLASRAEIGSADEYADPSIVIDGTAFRAGWKRSTAEQFLARTLHALRYLKSPSAAHAGAAPTRAMTADDLVEAVADITSRTGNRVATGDEIKDWCDQRGIDWGRGRGGNAFYLADHATAVTKLRKFKEEPLRHTGRNGWCLLRDWNEACDWCANQAPQWRAVPWDGTNWIWRRAVRVTRDTNLVGFDKEALRR